MTAPQDPIVTKLPALITKLDRPGDFYGSGVAALPVVRFNVEGVGDLGLPIPRTQGEALRSVAVDAPYGRGTRTLVDTSVRRCGQIEASAVRSDDARWRATLEAIVAAASKALGVDGEVKAELYKLLIYGPGDFFVEHRDTEKASKMFATLVVVLPSVHEGGELVVRHDGREVTLTLSGDDLGVARWAAFYCDCVHELRTVRDGYRVALVYNLTRRAKGPLRAPDTEPVVAEIVKALGAWTQRPDGPKKLVLPLAHRYSLAEFDFSALKNHDAAAAQALMRAATRADCTLQLAILSITESGAAEPVWSDYRRSRHSRDDDTNEDYEVVEVFERSCALRTWRGADGSRVDYGALKVDRETEVAPPGSLKGAEPDEDQLHEATGNGGASFERTYRWAALVLWPNARERDVLAQGGVHALLGAIDRYTQSDRERAQTLAAHTVASWPSLRVWGANVGAVLARALRTFMALGNLALVAGLLGAIAASGGLAGASDTSQLDEDDLDDDDLDDDDLDDDDLDDDIDEGEPTPAAATDGEDERGANALVAATVEALAALSVSDAGRLATALVTARNGEPFYILGQVLRGAARQRRDDAMRASMDALTAALVAMSSATNWGPVPYAERAQGLAELLMGAEIAGGAALAQRLARAVVNASVAAPPDEVLVPCALALSAREERPSDEAIRPLVEACVRHLEARCALPLSPPSNATRNVAGLTCACANCTSLVTFLRDPVAMRWQLKAAQHLRSHVEAQVQQAKVDVATSTIRSGSPHVLVCTKTTASYEARVRQREADTAALAALAVRPRRA